MGRTGTLYSIIFSTSLPTSIASTPLSTSYFADTRNPINQYLVKLTWLHTSIIYLAHLFTSSSRQTKFRRFAMYVLATAMWVGFTGFFFGRGLGDRVIEMSGGSCGLVLPEGLDLKESAGKMFSGANIVESSEGQLLQLPNTFCNLRKPLTPLSHPDLFKSLSASSSGNPLSSLVPKWRRGFDISGHSFILPLASVLLTHELAPTWRHWAGILPISGQVVHTNNGRGYWGLANAFVGLLGTMLVQLWMWMLGMTGAYFHDPREKLAGLGTCRLTFLYDKLGPTLTSRCSHWSCGICSTVTCAGITLFARSRSTGASCPSPTIVNCRGGRKCGEKGPDGRRWSDHFARGREERAGRCNQGHRREGKGPMTDNKLGNLLCIQHDTTCAHESHGVYPVYLSDEALLAISSSRSVSRKI